MASYGSIVFSSCLCCLNNNFIASGPVTNVIMHVKNSTIRATWQLPQCSGNIREIIVQYRKKGQSKWQWEVKAAAIADAEVIITGLEKGVEYEVRVVVVDTNGKTHEMAEKKVAIDGKCFLKAFISVPLISRFRSHSMYYYSILKVTSKTTS